MQPFQLFQKSCQIHSIWNLDKKLMGAGNSKLNTVGKAEVALCYAGRQCTYTIYVLDGLGKPALSKLQVIHFVDEVKSKLDQTDQYPKLFSGLV